VWLFALFPLSPWRKGTLNPMAFPAFFRE
jgi:hypothetical protein